MLRHSLLPVCALLAVTPLLLPAQKSERSGGPERGTWGAEASTGGAVGGVVGSGAALLRFVSPKTALVGALSFSRITERNTVSTDETTVVFTSPFTTVSAQAGIRRYTRTGLGLRPVFGGGVLLSRGSAFGNSDTDAGGYAEAGAAWFFNPHVSLGVLGGVSAVRNDGWAVGGSLARLTGAVYF